MTKNNEVRAFISIEDGLNENKIFNLNIAVLLLSFSTMLFHFAAVFFFAFKLESLILVGIFLGIGNFFAFLFDVPISILQNYFKSKTLLGIGAVAQIFAVMIFANFIFGTTEFLASELSSASGIGVLEFFLGDIVNWILLFIAAVLYGFNREINDITIISYILSKANPYQYKKIIAQKNIFYGIGSLLGLVLSGVVLSFTPKLIIIYLLIILVSIAYISIKSFDSKEKAINLSNISNFKIYFDKNGLNRATTDIKDNLTEKKDSLIQNVKSMELKSILGNTKYIFIKPMELKNQMIPISELAVSTKKELINIYETLIYAKDSYLIVYWSFYMLLIFGFWDTFASTFLLDFLNQVKEGWSYILLGIIALPAFGLQEYFGKLSDKLGVYKVANIGLAISGISLIIMSFFSSGELNTTIIIILALLNSVGYAIGMGLSVAVFLESYNKTYAIKNKLKQIDGNASAAPMKILQNLANVFGLMFGGIILAIAGYSGFFFLFGALIMVLLGWSLKEKDKITSK